MPAIAVPSCRHCGHAVVCRPRGLCWGCFYVPGRRELYGPVSSCGRRGVGHRRGPLPQLPTPHPPGSPEKIEELVRRIEQGFSLWHPADARFEEEVTITATLVAKSAPASPDPLMSVQPHKMQQTVPRIFPD